MFVSNYSSSVGTTVWLSVVIVWTFASGNRGNVIYQPPSVRKLPLLNYEDEGT